MNVDEVMQELESYGNEGTKKVLVKHGAKEPFFGVKVADLKKILKKTKKDHELALALYDTGNSDAMYLAGLMADENKMTREQLNDWVAKAYWYYLSEYAVAGVASETSFGFSLALEWIDSSEENIAAAGWAVLARYCGIHTDEAIDIKAYDELLNRVEQNIHKAKNRERYTMNGFVIAVGAYFEPLHTKAVKVAESIGKVEVEMGGTACKVPLATSYIQKVVVKDKVGVKRKANRC